MSGPGLSVRHVGAPRRTERVLVFRNPISKQVLVLIARCRRRRATAFASDAADGHGRARSFGRRAAARDAPAVRDAGQRHARG